MNFALRYPPFDKELYEEHEEIKALSPKQIFELRIALDVWDDFCQFHIILQIRVYGHDPPRPVVSFAHFCFDKAMMAVIRKASFEKPTPIQSQVIDRNPTTNHRLYPPPLFRLYLLHSLDGTFWVLQRQEVAKH